MQRIFSEEHKFRTWRRLWIALARAEQKQGLPITDAQIAELEAHRDDINYEDAERREKEVRHDVMSHVYAYGLQCPSAKGIIHLGATSCYVGDNTDILLMREGLTVVRRKLLGVMALLAGFAERYRALPALAYTHLQPAQLTTVGKRAALWLNEFYMDFEEVEHRIEGLALLGSKGTTGTQASFIELFDGDGGKVLALERDIAGSSVLRRSSPFPPDLLPENGLFRSLALAGIAQSAMKFGNDMRILQSFKEMREPFDTHQIRLLRHALQAQPHAL
jgi:adenylosuccinate lyase